MKNFILILQTLLFCLAFGSSVGQAETSYRLLYFPQIPKRLKPFLDPPKTILLGDDDALVNVSAEEVSQWSLRIHEVLGGCGGFWDITDLPNFFSDGPLLQIPLADRHRAHVLKASAQIEKLVALADFDFIWNEIRHLANFSDRSAESYYGARAAGDLLRQVQGLEAQDRLRIETIETNSPIYSEQYSILATLPGSDPSLPHVVLGAHFDTFSELKPGADDDATGTAIVLASLKEILHSKAVFRRTIDFVWYAAEERGLLGSYAVVKHFGADRVKVDSVLQLDMAGIHSPLDNDDMYLVTDNTDSVLNRAVKQIAEHYLGISVGETQCEYACSDHVNWNRARVPVSFPFETRFEHHNPRIHTSADTLNFLSPQQLTRFARLALAFLGELADLQALQS